MVCPYCSSKSRIVNSRKSKRHPVTWRRHRCIHCGADFTTYETLDMTRTYVVRSGSSTNSFDTNQLLLSMYTALDHRPNAMQDASHLCAEVCAKLVEQKSAEIQSEIIREIAFRTLKRFDSLAAIKYQATHEQISSYRDVRRVLKK